MYTDIKKIKTCQLDQLSVYREHLYQQPNLRQLFLELTLRCNAGCYHCGSNCRPDSPDGLPAQMYLKVLEEVRDAMDISNIQICVTGGEPLLRSDFFELMAQIKALGFHWGMTTNGTLIDAHVAAALAETGMSTVAVSIDGTENTHNKLRGQKNGYARSMAGIQHLIDTKAFKHIQVTTVVNHENINELDDMLKDFEDVDIDSWRIIGLEPIGRAKSETSMLLTDDDQRRLMAFIKAQRTEQMPVTYGCSHYLGLDYEREVRDWYFLCNAGIYSAGILANGDIAGCLDIPRNGETIQGNIYHDSFVDVWKHRFQRFRHPIGETCADCRTCQVYHWCGGGAAHSWDYENNRQQICFKNILF